MIEPWRLVSSTEPQDYRIFSIRTDQKVSPRTGVEHSFFVIDTVNWVNVVALTPDGQMVLTEQFRHGSGTVELEIPGGMMDKEDGAPEATAVRELREETGYEGERARIIGQLFPNPAIMSNTCYTVLIENCRRVGEPELDSGEDLITRLVPAREVPDLVAAGQIRHSLVIAGIYYFELWNRKGRG
jgi:8-oxo-dGTP pyrophosphatase MutT (NUDIX family)